MVNPLYESGVVFSVDGSAGFDRSAVLNGSVCGQCPHLVAGRHVGSSARWLGPVSSGS